MSHANSLARAVFIHRLGEIRDRTYENQQHRASGLNLLLTAIILWNTRYLDRAITALRAVEPAAHRKGWMNARIVLATDINSQNDEQMIESCSSSNKLLPNDRVRVNLLVAAYR